MAWSLTVAAIIEQEGRFLFVEETDGVHPQRVFNQPAGSATLDAATVAADEDVAQAAEESRLPPLAGLVESTGKGVASSIVSLDGRWLLATDPQNAGKRERWWEQPVPEAKSTLVPWIIQDAFPGYHGMAWYWRDFVAHSIAVSIFNAPRMTPWCSPR